MPGLRSPSPEVRESFLAALDEYHREGRYLDLRREELADDGAFDRFIRDLRAGTDGGAGRTGHQPPAATWWWVDGERYLGRLQIRHLSTEWLRTLGGHIGYDVRPAARRCGHGTAMLRASLPLAAELGIDPALVTCDVDNVGSRKIIERSGGQLFETAGGKHKFWVATGPVP